MKAILPYKIFFLVLIAGGAFMQLDMIWVIADIVNGLMAIPNLIGLVVLRHVVIAETQAFFSQLNQEKENSQPVSAL